MNRQTVIDLANKAVKEGMPAHLMKVCNEFAREYGEKHGISNLVVEDWIEEGREISSTEDAEHWINSLP